MRLSGLSISLKSFNVINNTSKKYDKILTQMTTGDKIQKASEDPVLAQKTIFLDNLKSQNEQYLKNAKDAKSTLNFTESVLGQVGDRLTRVRELTLQGSTDTMDSNSREAIYKEVDEIINEITNIANQQFNDKFLFSGTNTKTTPFELVGNPATGVNYNGNNSIVSYNISDSFKMESNLPGEGIFLQTITDLIAIRDDINNGNVGQLNTNALSQIDSGIDRIINARTDLGAKANTLDATISRLESSDMELTESKLNLMGVDIVQKQIELTGFEASYKASLSLVSKIHSMSILEYLR